LFSNKKSSCGSICTEYKDSIEQVLDALAQRHPVLRSKPDLRSRRWLPLGVNEKYYILSGLSIDVDSQGLEQAAADFVASELRIPPSIEPPAFRILQMFPSVPSCSLTPRWFFCRK
jgi:hypothetical protein